MGPVGLAETYSTLTGSPLADVALAEVRPREDRGTQRIPPDSGVEGQVDEARARHFDRGDLGALAEFCREPLGEVAGLQTGLLGEDHRGIGGEVAMARLPRRLHHDPREIRRIGKNARRRKGFHGRLDMRGEDGENVHVTHFFGSRRRGLT